MPHCKCCDEWTSNRVYCEPCIREDDEMTSQWEDRYIERCDAEFDDGAYERKQVEREQRQLEAIP